VYYTWCISIIVTTFQRTSGAYFIRPEGHAFRHGWPYFLLSFFLGWWGIPWGPVYTVGSMYTAFRGKDITQDVMQQLNARLPQDDSPAITSWEHFNRQTSDV
jgi:hypothetical protein